MIENMILVGSRALEYRAPQLLNRKPLNFDFICTKEAFGIFYNKFSDKIKIKKLYVPSANKVVVEGKVDYIFEIVAPGTAASDYLDIVKKDEDSLRTEFGYVPSLNLLFSLKKSHRHTKDFAEFFKTFVDYHSMKMAGCKSEKYEDWIDLREKEVCTKLLHSDVDKKAFFDDASGRELDFESVYNAMSSKILGGAGVPAYLSYVDDEEVSRFNKKKFFEVSEKIRTQGVLEEIVVLACVRSLHSHPGKLSEKEVFLSAYVDIANNHQFEWFREYAHESGPQIITNMPRGFSDHFYNSIKNKTIKVFSEKNND